MAQMETLLSIDPETQNRFNALHVPTPDIWATALGAWGDVLCACGKIEQTQGKAGILYYGFYEEIPAFLARQRFCTDVRWVKPESQAEYEATNDAFCILPYTPNRDFAPLAERAGIDPRKVVNCHVDHPLVIRHEAYRWHGARLSAEANWYATEQQERMRWLKEGAPQYPDYILFQPYSFNCIGPDAHWAHWQFAFETLVKYTPWPVVVVGRGWQIEGEHEQVIDLTNCTPSMESVFALAQRAKGVVTTANGLAMFSQVQQLQALVVGNNSYAGSYFERFADAPPVRTLRYDAEPHEFVRLFWEMFSL